MRSETMKGNNMSKFESIHLAPRKDKEVIYLCTWNDGEIVQIHTEKTLKEEYKKSNLFDCEESDETYFYNGSESLLLKDYLKKSKKDSDYFRDSFKAHNMEIERIV